MKVEEPPMSLPRRLYRAYMPLATVLRTNDLIHRCLFGYRPCDGSKRLGAYWDWTTLRLRQALKKHAHPGEFVLDMGTGSVGVLAVYACRNRRCRVVAVDWVDDMVEWSRRNAKSAGATVDCRRSNLFDQTPERFDVIVFNAPYLDEPLARGLGLLQDEISKTRFGGGVGGTKTIEAFLAKATEHLREGGRILLGVNHFHVNRARVQKVVEFTKFVTIEVMEGVALPGTVHVLRRG